MKTLGYEKGRIWQQGHYGYSRIVTVLFNRKRQTLLLASGTNDDLDLILDGNVCYSVSRNYVPYLGVEKFVLGSTDTESVTDIDGQVHALTRPVSDVFLQGSEQIDDCGKDLQDRTAFTVVRHMAEHLN